MFLGFLRRGSGVCIFCFVLGHLFDVCRRSVPWQGRILLGVVVGSLEAVYLAYLLMG